MCTKLHTYRNLMQKKIKLTSLGINSQIILYYCITSIFKFSSRYRLDQGMYKNRVKNNRNFFLKFPLFESFILQTRKSRAVKFKITFKISKKNSVIFYPIFIHYRPDLVSMLQTRRDFLKSSNHILYKVI